ncbi:MAG: xanthine phosphoribosyltransferase [Pseudomonadota bacterium]
MQNRLPHEKGFHVSWDQLHRDARALAWRLQDKTPADGWKTLVAVTRGGMVPAMIVARELDIRRIDTIGVRSYDHRTQHAPVVIKSPDPDIIGTGSGVLVVDDLADTGRTLDLVRDMMPEAHVATLYAKPMGRDRAHTYVTEVSQDTWIFFPWDMALQYVDPYRGS